jgi:hypothetical protein
MNANRILAGLALLALAGACARGGPEPFGKGTVAPDIEGVDLDGVAFKLSDYRGKVVFLDFWGDW